MPSPRYELLRSRELLAALMALGDIAEAADTSLHFAQAGIQALTRLVPFRSRTAHGKPLFAAARAAARNSVPFAFM